MNHWIIAPIVLPAILAPFLVLATRHSLRLQRTFSVAGTFALAAIALALTVAAAGGATEVYEVGNWPGPFGIVLVLDRLSALMVLLTGLLAVAVVVYAVGSGWDARGRNFHPLFQFQLMGICGAFLTGDAFNLFVFFEVLLIASYGLMIHGGGPMRLRAGVQYVVINLAGSTLFLFALGTLYGVTGTLNMADMALKVRELAPGNEALLRVGGLLLLIVFAIKSALVPIHFWLPGTYANAPAPVAALFAIMTKVGAYAILRVYTLVFGAEAGANAWLAADWLLPAALLTLALGMIGVLGSRSLMRLIAFSVIGSVGTLLVALSLFTPESTVAALYYLIHSTLATAALFLIADLILERRAIGGDLLHPAPSFPQAGVIAALFFAGAIGMTGMPPLSGFVGKLLVLDAARGADSMALIWTVILVTSLLAIVGFARAGSTLFWKSSAVTGEDDRAGETLPKAASFVPMAVTVTLLSAMVLLAVLAGPTTSYLEATARQLYDPSGYIEAVLGPR
ncbi:MAG: monovalent cation/H+ antiporter subunit D [Rhodovibrionaceae bacterium]